MGEVVELGPHPLMSAKEATTFANRLDWETVIICGYAKDNPNIVIMSSNMPRETALWHAEHLRLHALGRLD